MAAPLTRAGFIQKATEKHGSFYSYEKAVYVNSSTKLTITCPVHGDFEQAPTSHLRGDACPQCGRAKAKNSIQSNTNVFIAKANAVHGDKYGYSNVAYKNNREKIIVHCLKHGGFEQTPNSHLQGQGCPSCGHEKISALKQLPQSAFIEKAKAKHGEKYDYSKVAYLGKKNNVVITCPLHGDFEQEPRNHINGAGCPRCGIESGAELRRSTLDVFIEKARATHGDKYDYSKVVYVGMASKVNINCPDHGKFWQLPSSHLGGHGCQDCAREIIVAANQSSTDEFIVKAKLVHGDKYDYSTSAYVASKEKITIICPRHGEFEQRPEGHLQGQGCIRCAGQVSKPEIGLTSYIEQLGFAVGKNIALRKNSPYRFDGVIESKKLVIEFNGGYWHSAANKSKAYHINKRKHAESLGYEMLSIWEDDYLHKKDKVEALLRRKLLGATHRIFARKTEVVKLTAKQALAFHREHHLQESKPGSASLHYGLVYGGETIAAASFDKAGVLHRYTIKADTAVVGGMGKLIAAYRAEWGDKPITTYCDKDYFSGGLYAATGFTKVSETLQLTYLHRSRRVRREAFMKHKLPRIFGEVDMTKTEMQICQENNVFACFNSGVEKLVLF
jgi:ssDNA-binding Zn-finger/Zn-ribbon topoisomerase 1